MAGFASLALKEAARPDSVVQVSGQSGLRRSGIDGDKTGYEEF